MEEKLLKILTEELHYSPRSAQITCRDLLEIRDPEIRQALSAWAETRETAPASAEGFDAVSLSRRMYYPSALLAIDLLRRDPDRTKRLLKGFR